MLNKKERMEKMNAMGIETGKFFTVDLPQGLKPGSKITLSINENGECAVMDLNKANDPILNQIIEDGYVRNTKLHRRFVMAKMFQMLNYVSYDGKDRGYNDCLRRCYGYKYTIDMMIEEVRVLSKLETKDKETFEERAHFFDRRTIAAVLEDYVVELKNYVDKLDVKNCKSVPYKRVKSANIFVADLEKKLYAPVRHYANQVSVARNYTEIYRILCNFKRTMVKLPHDTRKSKAWIDAYKGEGAYYTLKNLIMFHDCKIYNDYNYPMYGEGSVLGYMNFLNKKLDEYKGEYYRMFALMKKVIADNNFDFTKRMNEIYNK
jgi:hypothetical protein